MAVPGFCAVCLAASIQPASHTPPPMAPAPTSVSSTLAAFSAHYRADWKSITVGASELELKPDSEPQRYVYTWTIAARGIFRVLYSSDVTQRSWFSVSHGQVRPQKYRAEDGASRVSIDFDWDSRTAHGSSAKKPVALQITEGTQDVMSIQAQVMLGLRNGNLAPAFQILDQDEVKEFIYTQEGAAKLSTALGPLDTLIVSSHRAGSNRILRMWFAPSLGFVPVQAERTRDGKLEFAMRIQSIKSSAE